MLDMGYYAIDRSNSITRKKISLDSLSASILDHGCLLYHSALDPTISFSTDPRSVHTCATLIDCPPPYSI